MYLSLPRRYALTIICLIISAVIALTLLFLSEFGQYSRKLTQTASGMTYEAMLDQAKQRAQANLEMLSRSLITPMYRLDLETIGEILRSAGSQSGTLSILVFDPKGEVLHDGGANMVRYGEALRNQVVKQALTADGVKIEISRETLQAAVSIKIANELLGGLFMEVSLNQLQEAADRLDNKLQGMSAEYYNDYVQLALLTALVCSILGALISIFIARGLARPIGLLSQAAKKIGQGEYDHPILVKRGDEVGELADSIREMAASLDASTVSKEFLLNIIHSIADGLLVVEPGGLIKMCNPALARMLGYGDEELLGIPARMIIPEFEQLTSQGAVQNRETHLQHKQGEYIPVRFACSLMNGPDQEPQAIICAASSMSELMAVYEEKSHLQKELAHSQRLQAIGTLASGVAHDFNNLLQIIYNCVELLSDELENTSQSVYITELERAAERAAGLVRHLLAFSRKIEPELKILDLNREVEQTAVILSRTLPRMIQIKTRLQKNLHPIKADARQLETMLMNLASNARDAMPEGGELIFETGPAGREPKSRAELAGNDAAGYLLLTVCDTGEGISDADKEHVFEPFFTTKPVGKGTGLGLSAAYGIVKSHGGFIYLDARPGGGACVKIYLPLAPGT